MKNDNKSNKMWGGRFDAQPDDIMTQINASIDIDKRLYAQDIAGSKAHAAMLVTQNIIPADDGTKIQDGLDQIKREIESGDFTFSAALEDIHMNIENRLKEIIGDAAGKLHTARSRNDQVATDFKLWVREACDALVNKIDAAQSTLQQLITDHHATIMPGFTHLQVAQPVTLAMHLGAYHEMLSRDKSRIEDCRARLNQSPLGSAALSGTGFNIDRDATAKTLDFDAPTANTMDGVASRDFATEFLFACAQCGLHLSRLAEEIILWSTPQFGFITLSDAWSTGSSIMPQKKNPDAAELVRAKTGRLNGNLIQLMTVLKALPLTYNKDLQEDKACVFESFDTIMLCLEAMSGMVATMSVHKGKMLEAAQSGYSTATEIADWLVRTLGLPFRDAHHITGAIVKIAEDKDCRLDELSLEDMQKVDNRITDDIFSVLSVKNLSVDFKTSERVFHAVKDISFDVTEGQTMALVGESGSGKSVSAMSIMQLLPYPLASHAPESSIQFNGEELIGKKDGFMRHIRGSQIGMIFQEPMTALNPLHSIERQIGEVLRLHQKMSEDQARVRVKELLDMVQLPMMKQRLKAYPHELSGGQRQRVMIAMALANNPELLIADEPTTALDVTVQAEILELLEELQSELNMAMLMITHDLSIVEKFADHVCIMQQGEIVEQGKTDKIFSTAQHGYSKKLLGAMPRGVAKPPKKDSLDIIQGTDIKVHFPSKKSLFGKTTEWVKAVDGINVSLKSGHTVGVVGESGSGKSTLGYALLRLLGSEGHIEFNGHEISNYNRKDMTPLRADMQVVFQDPFSALSPRMSIADIIGEGLKVHRPDLDAKGRDDLVVQSLNDVHLDPETRHRYPHEFSGGQRQRVAIARAMVLHPKFVVLDEPTSALDVSVQVEIIDLLRELQEKHDLAYLFISHDLRVVRAMAHDLIVMKNGKVVESGKAADIFDNPKQPYTKTLLDAALNLKAKKTG